MNLSTNLVTPKPIATDKQKEARRHNWVIYQIKGARNNLLTSFPPKESIHRKIDNFFSELLQIEYAIYKHNMEKLNGSKTP